MLTPFWVVAARLAAHDYRWHLPVECERRLLKICGTAQDVSGWQSRDMSFAVAQSQKLLCTRTAALSEPSRTLTPGKEVLSSFGA